MSQKVKDILSVIRRRLEKTGYPTISGRHIDVETDPTPCISIFFHPEAGIRSDDLDRHDTVRHLSRQTLTLVVNACVRVKDQSLALEELEDLHTTVHAALFDHEDRRLNLQARDAMMLRSRQSHLPDQHSDVGLIELVLHIPYLEEY